MSLEGKQGSKMFENSVLEKLSERRQLTQHFSAGLVSDMVPGRAFVLLKCFRGR